MERNCSDCLAPRLAQSLCTLCNKWLCYQCTNMHQHQRPFTGSQYADSHQQLQPPAAHCPDVHQRGPGPLPSAEPGLASYPCSLLMCHTHRQEPLELFCESCDLLCCSSCHLSGHKNHRLVHVGKALQEQQWLFESLVAQVDDRRATVENTAKQVEDRLHEVKIMQRKAENQIKMAKMIMMNELNKRASLLIEQLEKISEDFQRRLEDRLQGAIEICGQLDHVHKFITWATTQHGRSPVLFSKELISLQMQQLLEPSLYMDTWVPLKIKFNWDASYWTKQIASLGELDVEGGNCPFPEGLTCPGVLRPQPVPCLSLPSGCQRGREGQGCGYQACCQPQMCCLHMVASQPDLPSVHKKQPGPVSYSSSYVPPPLASFSLHQSQQLQQCWGAETPPGTQPSLQCPPASSPALGADSIRFSCSLDGNSQAQQGTHHSQPKQHPFKCLPDNHIQQHVDKGRPDPGKPFGCSTQQQQKQQLQRAAVDEEEPAVGSREGRRKEEQGHRHTGAVEGTGERCLEHTGVRGERRSRVLPPAERREERWGSRQPPLPPGDHGDGRRSTSLDDSLTAHQRVLRSGSACGRSNSRSQSIPAELAAPSSSPSTGGPAERTHSPEGGAPDKYCSTTPRRRRASDGVIQCVAREKHPVSLDHTRCRGQTTLQLSPLLSYKTEPDNSYGFSKDEVEYEVEDKCHKARKSKSNRDNLKNSDGPKVPMVCLERLKILVSRLPPHGRRQSDPLPASQVQSSGALPQKTTWGHGRKEGNSGCSEIRRTTLSFTTPPYKELEGPSQLTTPPVASGLYNQRGNSDPKYVTQLFSASDLDPDSEPGSASEPELVSEPEPEFDPRLGSESDLSQESDPCLESWSEAEGASRAQGESLCAGETDPCGDSDAAGVSEPSVEYQPGAEPRAEGGPGDVEDLEADVVSINGDAKSDRQPDSDPGFRADIDSDLLSDQPRDSQFSSESEPELESEADVNSDEPQPLRSDLEEDSPVGPAQRPLLIANPGLQRGRVGAGGTSPEQDENEEEMESEDYCTVCLIGGDLLCCDRCPKVYHLSCHIPPLLGFPTGDWMCTLCRDVMRPEVEYDCENESVSGPSTSVLGLSSCDQRKCERLTLLIFSNVLSAPFHEPVSPLARHYYQIIKRPMDLSQIRAKLNKNDTRHYSSPEDFVADVYLMFRNCAKFNYPDSEVAQAGHSLEAFFNCKLKEVFPHGAFLTTEEDSDSDEYDEAYRASENGFPWPERREQCHRKRKRRHSLNSRKHHP